MSEEVSVLRLGEHEYAAEVSEGHEATEHRVLLPQGLLDALDLPEVDEKKMIVESVKYLLERVPVMALPHDIDLESVRNDDEAFVPELRDRVIG